MASLPACPHSYTIPLHCLRYTDALELLELATHCLPSAAAASPATLFGKLSKELIFCFYYLFTIICKDLTVKWCCHLSSIALLSH